MVFATLPLSVIDGLKHRVKARRWQSCVPDCPPQ
jgi:hypothetical protein